MTKKAIIPLERIENKIYLIRKHKVMLDKDLAELYEVPTKRLNEQVRRNIKRFPKDFMFELSKKEFENLKSQIATSSLNSSLRSQIATLESRRGKHKKYLPYVFTEQGAYPYFPIILTRIICVIQ